MSNELTCYDKTTCRFAEEVRELRAALGRLQGEVETILNTEPHADSCPIGLDGACNCWQARLQQALDGEK